LKWLWALLALALPVSLGLSWAALSSPVVVAVLAAGAQQPCQAGEVVAESVKWRAKPGGSEADFVSSGLLRLQVCGPGTLSFTASGSPAAGQNALLIVALGARPLLETPVKQTRAFKLRVPGSGWLNFGFPNDYYKPPEDRNLFLSKLIFTPD
jgi:hypothetical protein